MKMITQTTCPRCAASLPHNTGAPLKAAGWFRTPGGWVCPLCRAIKTKVNYNDLREYVLSIPEDQSLPTATEIGKRFGVTRERIRQLLNKLESEGVTRNRWKVRCKQCGDELAIKRAQGSEPQVKDAGWIVSRYHNGKRYLCSECHTRNTIRRNTYLLHRETWPRPNSIPDRLLNWMKDGKPYSPTVIAKEWGKQPPHISKAKTLLIAADLWEWPLQAPNKHGAASNPNAPYIERYARESGGKNFIPKNP